MSHPANSNFARLLDFTKMFESMSISCPCFPAMKGLTSWFLHFLAFLGRVCKLSPKGKNMTKFAKRSYQLPLRCVHQLFPAFTCTGSVCFNHIWTILCWIYGPKTIETRMEFDWCRLWFSHFHSLLIF